MKLATVLMVVCLLLFISGCSIHLNAPMESAAEVTTTASSDHNTEATTSPFADETMQQPMFAVSLPVVNQAEKAQDGTILFNYTYQNISLILPDPEIADKIIVDFLNRIDATSEDADTIRTAAISDYANSSNWNPYLCQVTYNPMRIDSGILSLFGSYATYSGTPHPETLDKSVTYDLVTGNVLTLRDILTESVTIDTLCNEVINALGNVNATKILYKDYEGIVKDLFSLDPSRDEAWYFSQNGLCFYFNPYEIAPYASGVVIAEIPYEKLTGILNDAYFPAERQTATGNIKAEPFSENALEKFTQISEVVINQGERKIFLYSDSLVYDIRLETCSWSKEESIFTPEHTVFAACTLTPGDAVMVEAAIQEDLPTLRLSYVVNGETIYKYITSSEDDDSVLLTQK